MKQLEAEDAGTRASGAAASAASAGGAPPTSSGASIRALIVSTAPSSSVTSKYTPLTNPPAPSCVATRARPTL